MNLYKTSFILLCAIIFFVVLLIGCDQNVKNENWFVFPWGEKSLNPTLFSISSEHKLYIGKYEGYYYYSDFGGLRLKVFPMNDKIRKEFINESPLIPFTYSVIKEPISFFILQFPEVIPLDKADSILHVSYISHFTNIIIQDTNIRNQMSRKVYFEGISNKKFLTIFYDEDKAMHFEIYSIDSSSLPQSTVIKVK